MSRSVSSPPGPTSPSQGGSPRRNETLEERLLRKIPMLREMEMQDQTERSGSQGPAPAMVAGGRGVARRGSPRAPLDAEPLTDKRQFVRFEAQDDQDLNRYQVVSLGRSVSTVSGHAAAGIPVISDT